MAINDALRPLVVTAVPTYNLIGGGGVCKFTTLMMTVAARCQMWLSGLLRFLSHSTCWAYLGGDLHGPGIKSGSWHELSVGWTNRRYAMRLIPRTGTEGPPVSSLNCDRCRLWSYDIMAGYKCEYYYYYYYELARKCPHFSPIFLGRAFLLHFLSLISP